jgi:uncharacterized protein (TIGR03382 family)
VLGIVGFGSIGFNLIAALLVTILACFVVLNSLSAILRRRLK